eukprot:COSAG04_NODE_3691_length_2602_cov_1.890132_4_plen_234_part_01
MDETCVGAAAHRCYIDDASAPPCSHPLCGPAPLGGAPSRDCCCQSCCWRRCSCSARRASRRACSTASVLADSRSSRAASSCTQHTLISSQHTLTNPMRSAGARLLLLDPSHRVVSSGDLSETLRREGQPDAGSSCSSAAGGTVAGAVTNVAQPRVLVPKRRQPPRAVPVTLPLDPGVGCRPACVEQGRVGVRLQLLALRVPGLLLGRVLALHLFRPLVGRKCVLLRTPAGVRRP